MIRNRFFLPLMMFCLLEAGARHTDWQLLATIPAAGLDQISVDNKGNVFYSDKAGNIVKLDSRGNKAGEYSPIFQARLDQLEAFHTLNIFLFSADLQQFVLLDVFLNPLATVPLQHENTGIVRAATLGNNHIVWMVDEADLSLVKYDYRRRRVLQDQPLSLIPGRLDFDRIELIERQNMVFLNIADQGVFIFDNQGNFIKRLDIRFSHKLSFFEDAIYFIQDGHIYRVNVYSEETEKFPLPNDSFDKVLVSSGRIILSSPTHIAIYQYPK